MLGLCVHAWLAVMCLLRVSRENQGMRLTQGAERITGGVYVHGFTGRSAGA